MKQSVELIAHVCSMNGPSFIHSLFLTPPASSSLLSTSLLHPPLPPCLQLVLAAQSRRAKLLCVCPSATEASLLCPLCLAAGQVVGFMAAVGSGGGEGVGRKILKGDNEGECKLWRKCSSWCSFFLNFIFIVSSVLGPGLFRLHFQLLQRNGAAAVLSVMGNEAQ